MGSIFSLSQPSLDHLHPGMDNVNSCPFETGTVHLAMTSCSGCRRMSCLHHQQVKCKMNSAQIANLRKPQKPWSDPSKHNVWKDSTTSMLPPQQKSTETKIINGLENVQWPVSQAAFRISCIHATRTMPSSEIATVNWNNPCFLLNTCHILRWG